MECGSLVFKWKWNPDPIVTKMNAELPESEKEAYDDERCDGDIVRLQKALSDRARLIIIKSIVNNFIIHAEHAVKFIEEIIDWQDKLTITLLLSYKIPEGERDDFCQMVIENKRICKFDEDKEKLTQFLDYEFKEKEKEEKDEGPIVSGGDEGDDYYRWKKQ